MECTCNAKALVRTFGLMSGLAVMGVANAQSGVTSVPNPVEIKKWASSNVSVDALLDETTTLRGGERGAPPFTCPAGGSQQDLVNGPDFVGFALCGVFNPIDNYIPAVSSTPAEMCVRGDHRISFSSFPADLCVGIGIDADALVGWSFKIFNVDGVGMPDNNPPIYTGTTDGIGSNMTVQRFQDGTTYANTPGGRPIETYHLAFTGAPQLTANTCYWFGICWDATVNGNPDLANCTWRWGSNDGTDVSFGDGFVIFDADALGGDDMYGFCSVLSGDFDWAVDFSTIAVPDPNGIGCLSASIASPPTNETCATPIALTCDAETSFCPVLANAEVDSLNDPPISCLLGGSGADFLNFTTWYTVQPTDAEIVIAMCQGFNDGWDSAFAIYREDDHTDICTELAAFGVAETVPLTEFACSDSVCGNDPQVCLSGLTPGEVLYIMVGGDDNLNIGEVHFTITCDPQDIPTPANDDCATATVVAPHPIFGATIAGEDTTCAALDDQAVACGGTSNGNSPGLWYQMVGDGTQWNADACAVATCGPGWDMQLNVYCGDCNCGLVCVAGDDDGVCAPQSSVTWCTEVGETYYVFLHGFFDRGCYDISFTINFDGLGGCDASGNPDCAAALSCDVDVTGTPDYQETEVCLEDSNADTNGGCSFAPANPFEDLDVIAGGTVGYTIHGACFGANNLRDLDWYAFSVTQRGVISLTIESEFDGVINLQNSADCATNVTLATAATQACQGVPATISATLDPGTYVFFVSINDFNGFPCGCRNDYKVTIDYNAFGACCSDAEDTCFITDPASCAALGGDYTYQGDNTNCGVITYAQGTCPNVYSTIALGPISQQITLTDEDAEFFNLGFNFAYFGELKQSVAMISNGYLAFGNLVTIDSSPEAIPDASTPNDIVAGLWNDLDPATGTGEIWVAIDSLTDNAVFEWRNVGVFNALGAQGDNDFQIRLDGASGCIRLIYGALDLDGVGAQPTNADTVVGLENVDASGFNSVDLDAVPGSLENTCIEFCPSSDGSGVCEDSGFCQGDANADGAVNVTDISFVLFRLGDSTVGNCTESGGGGFLCGTFCQGDANADGIVNVSDISFVLFRLGDTSAGLCTESGGGGPTPIPCL